MFPNLLDGMFGPSERELYEMQRQHERNQDGQTLFQLHKRILELESRVKTLEVVAGGENNVL